PHGGDADRRRAFADRAALPAHGPRGRGPGGRLHRLRPQGGRRGPLHPREHRPRRAARRGRGRAQHGFRQARHRDPPSDARAPARARRRGGSLMIPSPRHSLLGLLCLLPALACAQEPGRVKFTLDWVIDGQQAPFFLAQAKGYFAQQGLAVTLDAGAGSAAAVQRVAQGTYDMGYGDTSALIEHLSKTADPPARVQAVYLTQDATPAGFTTLKKLNISTPADLAGRSIGGPVFDSARKLFPIFARAQSIDPASVKWQNLQPGLNLTQLARGQLDAASGFPSLQVGQIEAMGVKAEELVLFNYKDYGVHIYGNAIL